MIQLDILKNGRVKTLYNVIENGQNYFKEFIDEYPAKSEIDKLTALLEHIAEHGTPRNIEKFRPLRKGLFEIKSSKIRLICFFNYDDINNSDLIITHGFDKPKEKILRRQIDKSLRIKKEYESQERSN